MNVDPRGVTRGKCTLCSCGGYTVSGESIKCDGCGHPPAKHLNIDAASSATIAGSPEQTKMSLSPSTSFPLPRRNQPPALNDLGLALPPVPSLRRPKRSPSRQKVTRSPSPRHSSGHHLQQRPQSAAIVGPGAEPRCLATNCMNAAYFDLNTGVESQYCQSHVGMEHLSQSYSAMYLTDGSSDFTTSYSGQRIPHQPPPQTLFYHPSTQPVSYQHSLRSMADPTYPLPDQSSLPMSPPNNPFSSLFQQPTMQPVPQFAPPPSDPPLPDHLRCKYPKCPRKKFVESDGKTHEFCGRTHAVEYKRLQQSGSVSADMKCKTPNCPLQRCSRDDGKGYYDYCSITCRDSGTRMLHSPSLPNLSHGGTCKLPGCNKPLYVDPANNRVHDYCGRTHANEAQKQGIMTKQGNLKPLGSGCTEFTQVQSSFQRTWATGKGACPPITCVFLIQNMTLETRWKKYQKTVSFQTIEQHYHGTKLTCNVVAQKGTCNDPKCGVCGITLMGMDRQCVRRNISFQRFGHGFYVAPNSSKCHDYTQGNSAYGYRAILQCDILPGKKFVRTRGDQNLTQPPQGFHSVHGKTGGELNYEELVLYNPDCILPRYVIVYKKDGVHQIAK